MNQDPFLINWANVLLVLVAGFALVKTLLIDASIANPDETPSGYCASDPRSAATGVVLIEHGMAREGSIPQGWSSQDDPREYLKAMELFQHGPQPDARGHTYHAHTAS